jgi:hypothetical protein
LTSGGGGGSGRRIGAIEPHVGHFAKGCPSSRMAAAQWYSIPQAEQSAGPLQSATSAPQPGQCATGQPSVSPGAPSGSSAPHDGQGIAVSAMRLTYAQQDGRAKPGRSQDRSQDEWHHFTKR